MENNWDNEKYERLSEIVSIAVEKMGGRAISNSASEGILKFVQYCENINVITFNSSNSSRELDEALEEIDNEAKIIITDTSIKFLSTNEDFALIPIERIMKKNHAILSGTDTLLSKDGDIEESDYNQSFDEIKSDPIIMFAFVIAYCA